MCVCVCTSGHGCWRDRRYNLVIYLFRYYATDYSKQIVCLLFSEQIKPKHWSSTKIAISLFWMVLKDGADLEGLVPRTPAWTAHQDNSMSLLRAVCAHTTVRFLRSSHLIRAPILTRGTDALSHHLWASLVAQTVKDRPTMRETWVQSPGWDNPLEEGMATHSSILAWRIPGTEEPGGLQSITSFVSTSHSKQMEFIWITPERFITLSLPSHLFYAKSQHCSVKINQKRWDAARWGCTVPFWDTETTSFFKKYIFCLFIYLAVPGSSYAVPNTEKVECLWGQYYTSLKNRRRLWHLVLSLHGKSMGESGNGVRFHFHGLRNHCGWQLQPQN